MDPLCEKSGCYMFAGGVEKEVCEENCRLQADWVWRVYILEAISKKSHRRTIHVGIAKDVAKRVHEHRAGKVRATRGKDVYWLGNSERMTHRAALQLEAMLKKKSPAFKRAQARAWPEHRESS
jgi:predicted GIY-YIG superfamily endonuclease